MSRKILPILGVWCFLFPAGAATLYTDDGELDGLMEAERWLVNRSRFSPEQEADYYGLINSTTGGHPDYDVCEDNPADNSFGTTPAQWAPWKASKPPYSLNARLTRSSSNHALDMAIHLTGSHTSPSDDFYWIGANHWDRQWAEGYVWKPTYGGNGALYYNSSGYSPAHAPLFIDSGVFERGHRRTLNSSDFREVGYGWATTVAGQYYMCEDMALPASDAYFFTGTIFHDANTNKVYDNGEGVSGIEIRLYDNGVEGAWYDVSAGAGNFVIPLSGFASNRIITVELVNKTGATRDITIPTGWFLDRKITLVNNEVCAIGTFLRPASPRNVGFRNLTQLLDVPRITTQPPTMLTQTSAVLNASLVCTGKTYGVRAYWGTSNGGTNAGAWANSAYAGTLTNAALTNISCNATELTLGTDYYVTFRMTNATDSVWAKNTMRFITLGRSSVSNSGVDYTAKADVVRLAGEMKDGPADTRIFWGKSDGGTNFGSWENMVNLGTKASGSIFCTASNIYYGQQYYYRCYVSNTTGVAWAPATTGFEGPVGGLSKYRIKVDFTNYNRAEILTNFPVLVVLSNRMGNTDFSFKNFLSSNGYDLRFRDGGDTTNLNYEIESWSTGGCSYVWVQVPRFTNNCSIWATWGDVSNSNRPAYSTNGATWPSQYRGVWHLGETVVDEQTAGKYYDSTSNRVDGTQNNNSTIAGVVGNGQFLDGAGDQINVAHKTALSMGSVFTYSGWFRYDGPQVNWRAMVAKGAWEIWTWSDNGLEYYINYVEYAGGNIVPSWSLSSWYYLTIVFNNTSGIIYRDGYQRANIGIASVSDNTTQLVFGQAGGDYWVGAFDEFRIETGVPSSNRVWATYMNMASNSWFNSVVGNVQTVVSSISRSITNLTATSINANDATLNARLNCSGAVYNVYAYWGATSGGTNIHLWDNSKAVGSWTNTTSVNVSTIANSLSSGETYYYTFCASNSAGRMWATNIVSFTTLMGGNARPSITEGDSISVTMSEDGSPTPFSLTLHATDADSDPITWSISSPATYGTATASGTGTVKVIGYAPVANSHGSDSFMVHVADGISGSDDITVNVTVDSVTDIPFVANGPAAPASTNSAELAGSLASDASTSVWVCWGDRDAGDGSTGAWDHVVFVANLNGTTNFAKTVTGLAANATYWFRCYATNSAGADWSDSATAFSAEPYSRPWTPADMTTLAWFDAADASTITQTGTGVGAWNDKSGNSRHVLQGTDASRPSLTGSNISFNGTSDYLWNSSPFMYANGSISVMMVAAVATNADKRIVSENNTTNTNPFYAMQTGQSDGSRMASYIRNDANGILFGNALSLSGAGAYNDTPKIYNWRDTGTQMSGRVNGGTETPQAYTRSGAMTANTFAIGAVLRGTPTAWCDCDLNEIVITAVLNDANRQKLEGYLAWKWNLSGSLPAGHPYKSNAPVGGAAIMKNLAPTSITSNQAMLNATLATGSTNFTVYVHWGTTDGSTNLTWASSAYVGSWTNAALTNISLTATTLLSGTKYFYTFRAVNAGGSVWATPSWQFTTTGTNSGAISYAPQVWLASFSLTNGAPEQVELLDPDNDRALTWQEYVAGTDPTNNNDVFSLRISSSNGQSVVSFESRTTTSNHYGSLLRRYTLEYLADLAFTNWSVVPGYSNLSASGLSITYTNNSATNLFYRAKAWLE